MKYISIVMFLVVMLSHIASATAASEYVYVYSVDYNEDTAIVVRRNGDVYMIEKGVGCLSLWSFTEKTVVIESPGLFAGVGSHLIIPDLEQKCRIWNAKLIW